jgi:hypothetical protein
MDLSKWLDTGKEETKNIIEFAFVSYTSLVSDSKEELMLDEAYVVGRLFLVYTKAPIQVIDFARGRARPDK